MCGYFGSINIPKVNIDEVKNTLINRGPDGNGTWINDYDLLIHSRLAIQDLTNKGAQPMKGNNQENIIVFNGEIYNTNEIKRDLIKNNIEINTRSDTELIIKGYELWSHGLWSKLNGIFSIAIWNIRTRKLILVRDSFGVKPLYYFKKNNKIAFGSLLRSFQKANLCSLKTINQESILSYLYLGSVTSPNTIFSNIFSFPPGHYAEWTENNGLKLKKYKRFKKENIFEIYNYESAVDIISKVLDQVVKNQLVGDVPIALFLSGGIDSGLLAARMRKFAKNNITSINVGWDIDTKEDESFLSELTAKRFGLNHLKVNLCWEDFNKYFDGYIDGIDQPSIDGLNTFIVSKCARDIGVKVAFSGLGADEIFGGYGHMHFKNQSSYLNFRKLPFTFMVNNKKNKIYQERFSLFEDIKNRYSNQDIFSARRDFEMKTYLTDTLLRDADCLSMFNSIENRVPYLDENLFNVVSKIPDKYNYFQNKNKSIIYSMALKELDQEIYKKKKSGFILPISHFINSNKRFKLNRITKIIKSNLDEDLFLSLNFSLISSYYLSKYKNKFAAYWRWIILSEWLENNT